MNDSDDSPVLPSVVAISAGGGAVAWMLWSHGLAMFSHWFFYPSLILSGLLSASLVTGLESSFSRLVWQACMGWSGFWSLVFLAAMVAPPFSMLLVGGLVEGVLEAGAVHPFLAGFLHILVWACARDVLRLSDRNRQPRLNAGSGGGMSPDGER